MDSHTLILITMLVYVILLVGWGVFQGQKVKSSEDYAIAGRNLPGWVAALSERATGESSWALLGLPGAAYAMGISEIWTAIGCVVGIVTAWALLAWRLRDAAEKYKASTFTELLAKSHPEKAQMVRLVSSAAIVFFFFFYVGAQFLGGGKTLHAMFGLNARTGMVITAAVIIPYTIYGGFQSVVYTDVVQAIVMIVTLIVGPLVGFFYVAHHPGLYAHSINLALIKAGNSYTSLTRAASGFSVGVIIVGGFSWFFGYLGGQPQLTTRFMAIRNPKHAKAARNVGIAWTLVAYLGALSIGWLGLAIFGPHGLSDRETVMPKVMLQIFHPVFAAILITGAVAAMISTADSLLILSATEFSENILKPLMKNKTTLAKHNLLMSRVITAGLALIALLLSWITGSKTFIFTLVSYVWAGIGGTFSVVILLTLFWKRYHGKAVIITIIYGILFTIIWINTGMDKIITSRIMTFVTTAFVAVLSTLLLKEKTGEKTVLPDRSIV